MGYVRFTKEQQNEKPRLTTFKLIIEIERKHFRPEDDLTF